MCHKHQHRRAIPFFQEKRVPGKLEIRLGSFLGGIFPEAKLNHHDVYPSDMIRLLWKSTRRSVGGLQFDLFTVPVITPLVIFGAALRLANTRWWCQLTKAYEHMNTRRMLLGMYAFEFERSHGRKPTTLRCERVYWFIELSSVWSAVLLVSSWRNRTVVGGGHWLRISD